MDVITDFRKWSTELVSGLDCQEPTKAYIVSVLAQHMRTSKHVLETSITLAYIDATNSVSFEAYQRIGDWVLWAGTTRLPCFDEHRMTFETFGRLSYYRCYRMLNGKWPLYEELADNLPCVVEGSRKAF